LAGGCRRAARRWALGRCGCASGGGRTWGARREERRFLLRLRRRRRRASRGRSLRLTLARRARGWRWARGVLRVGLQW
jgi:hypothetical protein